MNPILQALQSGYPEEEILSFLSKAIPQMGFSIKKATKSGYGAKQILGFLSKNFDTESLKGKSESEIHAINRRADAERTKYGLKAAATAIATPLAANIARSAISRALPQSLKNLSPPATNLSDLSKNQINSGEVPISNTTLEQTSQSPQIQTSQSLTKQPPSLGNANIQQPSNIEQPKVISNPKEYLEKLGVLDRVKALLKTGNTPEGVAAALSMKRSGEAKIDPELLKNIEEFVKLPQEEAANIKPEVKELAETPKIEKNALVSSPNGLGEVKEIRNGKALIEINGRLHKVKEEDLEVSPLPEKDLADLYDELIKGIEGEIGEDVSRMVQWAGYNPTENSLTFLPHTGKLYKYSNISPEDAALLTDILSTRKTSGENFIGAWKAGSKSPIGAALSKLIKKLQSERGGKGNEYEETHEPIYSAYEPAIQAKKKKKKK